MESRSPAYIAVLAVIAGSILMVGSLMKPASIDADPAVLPTQAESARLQRMAQRRSIESMAQYFAETASGAATHLVYLEGLGQTAVLWDTEGTLITSNTAALVPEELEVLGARGATYRLRATPTPPESPVASLQAQEALEMSPAMHLPVTREYGEWLVLTWLRGPVENAFAPGLYLGFRAITCGGRPVQEVSLSVTPSEDMAGAGLFDLDGRLIGVVTKCDGRYAALLPESIDETIQWNKSFMGRLLGQYGLLIASLTDEEKQYFDREEAVLIREIWRGLSAATAGLRPGDLILSFDGRPVTKPEDLQPLVLPAARHLLEIVVRRGGRNITVVLPAQVDPVAAAPEARQSGLIVADELGGFPVQAVLAGSAAARLGMRSGDRLLVVDGAQVSSAVQARRILSSDKAEEGRFIVVQRGRKQWGALLN
jgi:serine protease Do